MSKLARRQPYEVDGRLLEAAEEQRLIAELTEHVGGSPTLPQRLLIQRIARTSIIVSVLERKVIEQGELGDLQSRQVNALWNTLTRCLTALGMKSQSQKSADLAEFLGRRPGRPKSDAA
jgi:hypothetical protein